MSLGKSKPHKSEISFTTSLGISYQCEVFTKLPSWKLTKEGRTLSLVRSSPQMSRLVTSERWMVGKSGQGIWLICRDREPSSLRLCRMSSKASLWGTRVGLLLDVTSCVSKGKFLCLTYESSKDMLNA